ncbi:FUSC family protein [Acerihabitans sp. KWT182]|uniref:FUSC family protein n=1 Tax=Acerihabitans sp. KWT182 TaxID=3157919 RepID=A0AAU7Q931_9GAMM
MIASIAVVIGIASPHGLTGALEMGGWFLAGSAWTLFLCVFLWRTSPRRIAQRRLVILTSRLEDMATLLIKLDCAPDDPHAWARFDTIHRRGIRTSIERARQAAAYAGPQSAFLKEGVDAASRTFSALISLGRYRRRTSAPMDAFAPRPLLPAVAHLLRALADELDKGKADYATVAEEAAMLSAMIGTRDDAPARAVAFTVAAIAGFCRQRQASAIDHMENEPVRVYLHIDLHAWRNALRVATAASIAYVIGVGFNIALPHWGVIAALLVTQPMAANTWLRIVERACGSLIGGAFAALLIAQLNAPWSQAIAIVVLATAVIACRLVNYGLFVVFLTPMFMLLSDFIKPAEGLIFARIVNELLGACIGAAASVLLWPVSNRDALASALSDAIAANMAFAAAVLKQSAGDSGELDRMQREAGLASTRLEVARERLLFEGRTGGRRMDRVWDAAVALRGVCGASAVLEILCRGTTSMEQETRADEYGKLAVSLQQRLLGNDSGTMPAFAGHPDDDLSHAVRRLVETVNLLTP